MAIPTALSGVAYRVKINGKNLYELGVLTYDVPHMGSGPIDVQQVVFPERLDAYGFRSTFQPRPFVISGTMIADSAANLRTNLDLLKGAVRPTRGDRASTPTKIRIELADQTDRFWPCAYPGGLTVLPIPQEPTRARHASFTLPLLQLTPFAVAVEPTSAAPSAAGANSFTVLDTGTAPCPFVVELEGAATAPDFVITNTAFWWDCDYSMGAEGIDGSTLTGTCGLATDSDAFEPGDYEKGRYLQASSFTTSFASVVANPTEGTLLIVGRPLFANTVASIQSLLTWYIDANNQVHLYFDSADDKFKFYKKITSEVTLGAGGAAQTFATDAAMVVAASWGPDGMKVYRDGALLDSNATTTGVTGTSGSLFLCDNSAAYRPDFDYEYVIVLPFQLTDEQVTHLSTVPEDWRPVHIKKSKAGNLGANERSVLNFGDMTAIKVIADLTTTNDLGDWDTRGWPPLQPPAMCFHCPASETIGGIKVRYRKRWL